MSLAAAAAATPTVASAGTFTVASCRTADGKPAPTDGWVPTAVPSAGYGGFNNTCAGGGSLNVNIDGTVAHPNGDTAGMRFQVGAAGLVLRSASLWRYARVDDAGPYATWLSYISAPDATYGSGSIIDRQYGPGTLGLPGSPLAAANRIEVPVDRAGTADATINASVFCATQGGYSCGAGASLDIYAAQIQIDDTAAPVVVGTSGDLVPDKGVIAPQLAGTRSVVVQATDVGSGLARAVVVVDGQDVDAGTFGDNTGRCVAVAAKTYKYRQPCSSTGAATVSFDTTKVADGSHTVQVVVEDASGTRTPAAAGTVLIKNATQVGPGSPTVFRGAPNGSADTDEALLSAVWPSTAKSPRTNKRVVTRCARSESYRKLHPVWCNGAPAVGQISTTWSKSKATDLAGRLTTTSGAPIAGASLDVYGTPMAQGAATRGLANLTTDSDGRFSVPIPRSAGSMGIRVQWRSHQGDTVPVSSAELTRVAKAATGLTAPRSARRGARVKFAGTLRSKEGNLSKVPISLQVRQGGRWKTFASATTGARGKWRKTVAFARTPGTYKIRARVGTTTVYPWAAGYSVGTVKVRVR